MATLPEIETIRRELEREAIGKKIKESWVSPAALVSRHGTITDFCAQLEGRKIEEVDRKGLAIIITLDSDKSLICVPGTRSRVTRKTATAARGQYTRFVFGFTTGGSIHYSDKDVDGAWFFATPEQIPDLKELTAGGMDPFGDAIKWTDFARNLIAKAVPLYTMLLDESFMIGIGEVYANEALFRSGLSPLRLTNTLSNQEFRRLQRSIFEVLQDATKEGGINMPMPNEEDDYADPGDLKFLEIYGREGRLDRRSRVMIERIEVEDGVFAYKSASQS